MGSGGSELFPELSALIRRCQASRTPSSFIGAARQRPPTDADASGTATPCRPVLTGASRPAGAGRIKEPPWTCSTGPRLDRTSSTSPLGSRRRWPSGPPPTTRPTLSPPRTSTTSWPAAIPRSPCRPTSGGWARARSTWCRRRAGWRRDRPPRRSRSTCTCTVWASSPRPCGTGSSRSSSRWSPRAPSSPAAFPNRSRVATGGTRRPPLSRSQGAAGASRASRPSSRGSRAPPTCSCPRPSRPRPAASRSPSWCRSRHVASAYWGTGGRWACGPPAATRSPSTTSRSRPSAWSTRASAWPPASWSPPTGRGRRSPACSWALPRPPTATWCRACPAGATRGSVARWRSCQGCTRRWGRCACGSTPPAPRSARRWRVRPTPTRQPTTGAWPAPSSSSARPRSTSAPWPCALPGAAATCARRRWSGCSATPTPGCCCRPRTTPRSSGSAGSSWAPERAREHPPPCRGPHPAGPAGPRQHRRLVRRRRRRAVVGPCRPGRRAPRHQPSPARVLPRGARRPQRQARPRRRLRRRAGRQGPRRGRRGRDRPRPRARQPQGGAPGGPGRGARPLRRRRRPARAAPVRGRGLRRGGGRRRARARARPARGGARARPRARTRRQPRLRHHQPDLLGLVHGAVGRGAAARPDAPRHARLAPAHPSRRAGPPAPRRRARAGGHGRPGTLHRRGRRRARPCAPAAGHARVPDRPRPACLLPRALPEARHWGKGAPVTARLQALGTAMPDRVYKQDEIISSLFARLAGWDPDWAEVFEASGVERRAAVVDVHAFYTGQPTTAERMRAFAPAARRLGAEAARQALERGGAGAADEVGDLVVVSCTGYSGPGLDVHLAADLGLGRGVRRLALGHMGCYAALPALRTAAALVGPDTAGPAGGAAGPAVVAGRTITLPGSEDRMGWLIGDDGFHMSLSPRVPALVDRGLGMLVEQLLEPHGLAPADVAHWAVHPGGPEILDRVQRRLGLSDAQLAPSWEVLADGGNRSSATVLFILESLVASGELRPGQWLVTLGFGTGLTLEALLLRA